MTRLRIWFGEDRTLGEREISDEELLEILFEAWRSNTFGNPTEWRSGDHELLVQLPNSFYWKMAGNPKEPVPANLGCMPHVQMGQKDDFLIIQLAESTWESTSGGSSVGGWKHTWLFAHRESALHPLHLVKVPSCCEVREWGAVNQTVGKATVTFEKDHPLWPRMLVDPDRYVPLVMMEGGILTPGDGSALTALLGAKDPPARFTARSLLTELQKVRDEIVKRG